MGEGLQLPEDWTKTEQWVWGRIFAGQIADLNLRDREGLPQDEAPVPKAGLDPRIEQGWPDRRRLRSGFLQRILTNKAFVEATPLGGVRILGALVDDGPLELEYVRLAQVFWLKRSRLLGQVQARNLRIDGELSFEASLVAQEVDLSGAEIREGLSLAEGCFEGSVNLTGASIGSQLDMSGSTFKGSVSLNGARMAGAAFLGGKATFKELDLTGASIGSQLVMKGSTFEGPVCLTSARVAGEAVLKEIATFQKLDMTNASIGSSLVMSGSTFKGPVCLKGARVAGSAVLNEGVTFQELDLINASIGSSLVMSGSTFKGPVCLKGARVAGSAVLKEGATFKEVDLSLASIGLNLRMEGSTFGGPVSLNSAKVAGGVFLNERATFKQLDLTGAAIGSDLDLSDSDFADTVNLTGATIGGEFRLGSAKQDPPRWEDRARLVLRNARCAALQWSVAGEAWPQKLSLEGFTYERLGGLGDETSKVPMLERSTSRYVEILRRDLTASPQPYEYLAQVFRAAGEPGKANEILYQARERQRANLREPSDSCDRMRDQIGRRFRRLGLWILKETIGYGLGLRYFCILPWVLAFTLLGMDLLLFFGSSEEKEMRRLFFVSLDALLPIVTLDPAHEAVLTGSKPPQPYWLQVYFHVHKLLGWVIGSFLVAALAGLTQRS